MMTRKDLVGWLLGMTTVIAILSFFMPAFIPAPKSEFWLFNLMQYIPWVQTATMIGVTGSSVQWYVGCMGGFGFIFGVIGVGFLFYSCGILLYNYVYYQDLDVWLFIEDGGEPYIGILQGMIIVLLGALASMAWIVTIPALGVWGMAFIMKKFFEEARKESTQRALEASKRTLEASRRERETRDSTLRVLDEIRQRRERETRDSTLRVLDEIRQLDYWTPNTPFRQSRREEIRQNSAIEEPITTGMIHDIDNPERRVRLGTDEERAEVCIKIVRSLGGTDQACTAAAKLMQLSNRDLYQLYRVLEQTETVPRFAKIVDKLTLPPTAETVRKQYRGLELGHPS